MKIALAQIKPEAGNVSLNLAVHQEFIKKSASVGADLVIFPELSLTGYGPRLASELAFDLGDQRLDIFQEQSNHLNMVVCVGLPTRCENGVRISMLICAPNKKPVFYSKQYLHEDEFPYFQSGDAFVFIEHAGMKLCPAICYESLLPEHIRGAAASGPEFYLASVAKSHGGVMKARSYYPMQAKVYGMTILMCNCIGPCDDFESVGMSAVWDREGTLLGQLGSQQGILVYDSLENKVQSIAL